MRADIKISKAAYDRQWIYSHKTWLVCRGKSQQLL